MMKIKQGVQLQGMRPELVLALVIAQHVYSAWLQDLVITSVVDGKHSPKSLHYSGCAVDIRLPSNRSDAIAMTEAIGEALGNHFDVVLEHTHIHIEYQPVHVRG